MVDTNGDTLSPKTHAEARRSPFNKDTLYTLPELVKILDPVIRYRLGSAERVETAQATILALKRLQAERGVELFEGRKVTKVYLAAARACGWFIKSAAPFVSPEPCAEGFKFCIKCRCAKPYEDFLAPATAAQRQAYGWPPGYRPDMAQRLCGPCRLLKASHNSYIERKRALKAEMRDSKEPQVMYWAKMRKSIQLELASTRMAYQSRKQTFTDAEGVVHTSFVFSSFAHEEYYTERLRLGKLAQDRLKELVDHGELSTEKGDPLWYLLLETPERERLGELYRRVVWTNRGITPALWR